MTTSHYTLMYHILIPNFSLCDVMWCDVIQNTWQSIWTTSLWPATLTKVIFKWSIWDGTLPVLSSDEGNRSTFMKLNAYSQHYFVSVSEGVRCWYRAQATLSSKTNSSTLPDTFGSQTARQIFVYLLQTEYKLPRVLLEEAQEHIVLMSQLCGLMIVNFCILEFLIYYWWR